MGGKEESQSRCPICLDACTKSTIELRCGHSFCRSCLTRSAANNMTSCALCRREQEINPELLRARFDEQRMLNLAQRLAIPPPLRPRPSSSAASMTAAEGEREGKGGLRSGGTPTLAKEMLFGPWGDVGAMSAADLRRRWKFGCVNMSTVGAASASEIRSSWQELKDCMYMQNDSEYLRADSMSCSGDTESVAHEAREDVRRSPTARPESPVAGGSSPADLSNRWRTLTKILPCSSTVAEGKSTDEGWGDSGSLDKACLRKRWLEANELDTAGHLEVGELTARLKHAIGSEGSGGLDADCLRRTWHEANGLDSSVGHLNVLQLSERLNLVMGSRGVGAVACSDLVQRWNANVCHDPLNSGNSVVKQAVALVGNTALRSSWCTDQGSAPVG